MIILSRKLPIQLYISIPGSTLLLFQHSMGCFLPFIFDLINDSLQNRLLGWELANAHGNNTLVLPVLAIYPKQVRFLLSRQLHLSRLIIIALQDPVADWEKAAKIIRSSEFLPNLTVKVKHFRPIFFTCATISSLNNNLAFVWRTLASSRKSLEM